MNEQEKAERERNIRAMMAEMKAFDDSCGAVPPRDPGKLRRDAEWVNMVRHEGITVETLAMMMTDMEQWYANRLGRITEIVGTTDDCQCQGENCGYCQIRRELKRPM